MIEFLLAKWQPLAAGLGAVIGGFFVWLQAHMREQKLRQAKVELAKTQTKLEDQRIATAQAQNRAEVKGMTDAEALRAFNDGSHRAASDPPKDKPR